MATIRFSRTVNVRRYTDYEVDTEDLTPEQLAAVEQIGKRDGEIDDPDTFIVLEDLCDDLTDIGEDYEDSLDLDQRNPDFMLRGGRP